MINLIINKVFEVFHFLISLLKKLFSFLINHFTNLNVIEKIIIYMTIPTFFAVVLPMARYYIFESYMTINNPFAVYLIGIVIIMLIGQFISSIMATIIRCSATMAYFISLLYLHLTHEISKAPYEIMYGFYINILIIVLYFLLSVLSYILFFKRE